MSRIDEYNQLIQAKLQEAKDLFGFDKPVLTRHDIRGRKAGQAGVSAQGNYYMRFNRQAIEDHFDEMIHSIPHEIAHLVCFWNPRLGKDHDEGWKRVAMALGDPDGGRCHNMPLQSTRPAKPKPHRYTATDGRILEVDEKLHQNLQSGRYPYARLRGTRGQVRIYAKDFIREPIAGPQGLGNNGPTNQATPHTENNEDTDMTATTLALTPEAKAWIKKEAKDLKINPVGKSMETILSLIDERTGRDRALTLYLANGGCIKELPGFEGIKPLPNRKETSAGGKTSTTERRKPTKSTGATKTEPTEKKAAKNTGDVVSLASILEELGVEGRIARRKLRGSDIEKPGSAWEWPTGHADITKVKELLKK